MTGRSCDNIGNTSLGNASRGKGGNASEYVFRERKTVAGAFHPRDFLVSSSSVERLGRPLSSTAAVLLCTFRLDAAMADGGPNTHWRCANHVLFVVVFLHITPPPSSPALVGRKFTHM